MGEIIDDKHTLRWLITTEPSQFLIRDPNAAQLLFLQRTFSSMSICRIADINTGICPITMDIPQWVADGGRCRRFFLMRGQFAHFQCSTNMQEKMFQQECKLM